MGVKTFTLRLSEEQHKFLEKKSNELGLTKNDYLRQLLDDQIIETHTEELLESVNDMRNLQSKMIAELQDINKMIAQLKPKK